jgi:GDPmannose 4,6-dehydratase
MSTKKAFITGVSGQDGSYLVDLLVSKGYEVHGLVRQSTQFTPDRWGHLRNAMQKKQLHVHYGDLTDSSGIRTLIEMIRPDEVYNLAAQSHVGISFEQPENTSEVTAMGPLKLLEAIRRSKIDCRFYQASSSEQFGKVQESPQHETTNFYPRSPYGCAKVYAHFLTQNYREAYGMFAVSGILFNHESERRGENFVTRKITRAIGRIKAGTQNELVLGNTDARRDWGYAPDYVEAMWLMLQKEIPEDFVIGTGEMHSVQEFIERAFAHVDLDWRRYVRTDPQFIRPSEVDTLLADPSKAREKLNWEPKVRFPELVTKMVDHDVQLALREKAFLEP